MIPRPSVAIAGTTGAQQRDRHALSKRNPYRWHGKPGWNPANALHGYRSKDRMQRQCPTCDAPPGEKCRTVNGVTMPRTTHDGR